MSYYTGTPQDALATLTRLTAASTDPEATLDPDELQDLLDAAQRRDSAGRPVDDPGWQPTWNLDAAAAEGWQAKAGLVATSASTVNVEGDRGPDSFKYLNCVRQADHYARRAARASIGAM